MRLLKGKTISLFFGSFLAKKKELRFATPPLYETISRYAWLCLRDLRPDFL